MDDDYRVRVRNGQVAVALLEELPVGLIVTDLASDHLFVENVAVDPAHHGRGVGGALLQHAEDMAERAGVPEVRLYTNAAMVENLAMYPKRGYEERGRRTEDGFDRVYFARAVPDELHRPVAQPAAAPR